MQARKWVKGLAVGCLVLTSLSFVGCSSNPQAAKDNNRYGTNSVGVAPNAQNLRVPNWDNKNQDVDGDGDREQLSGHNNISNPSIDLRSFANPGGGSDLTNGIYPHTFTADRVADLASSVNGIANARAVIAGQTLLLGMNLERSVKPFQRDDLVQQVRQRILVQAPEFKRVHITTDRALNRRIQRIADEMRAGHSLTMFNDDVMDLASQIPPIGPGTMPAVPR